MFGINCIRRPGMRQCVDSVAKNWVDCINECPPHSSSQQNSVHVGDVAQQVLVGGGAAAHGVVGLALGVEVVLAVGDELAGVGIDAEVAADDDAGVVEVVALDGVDRADLAG